ncbi:hypothetical protein BH23CHL2_BH23CHL2_18650 [soil metagenome]
MDSSLHRPWDVLLIGGVSGAGKTMEARELARRLAVPWIGVDDLRLALQWSRVSLPEPGQTGALYFFLDTPDVWSLPPERLRDGLIDVAELMTPAIEIVIQNHLHNGDSLIIEGDGIHPRIVERSKLRLDFERGAARAVFVHEPYEGRLYANYITRQRLIEGRPDTDLRNEARAKALFSEWIAAEARKHGLPVIDSRPFDSLLDRIMSAVSGTRNP